MPSTHSSLQGGAVCGEWAVSTAEADHISVVCFTEEHLFQYSWKGGCIPPMPVDAGLEEARGYGR